MEMEMDNMEIDAPSPWELLDKGVDLTNNLTEEERELFRSWHQTEASTKEDLEGITLLECCMRCIGASYKSVKKTRSDMIQVLGDDIAQDNLLQFATGVLKCCKFSSRVKVLFARLLTEYPMNESAADIKDNDTVLLNPIMGHLKSVAKSEEVSRSERGEHVAFSLTCSETLILNDVVDLLWELEVEIMELQEQPSREGGNQISVRIYNILLIMKEMMTQIGTLSEVFDAGTSGFHPKYDSAAADAVFFLKTSMRTGINFTLQFYTFSTGLKFLEKEVAEAMPFSLNEIFNNFSVNPNSSKAASMKKSVELCQRPSQRGEVKLCVHSLDSMMNFVQSMLGTRIQGVSTEPEPNTIKQKYTITQKIKKLGGINAVACHIIQYAYPLFYCHRVAETETFQVIMVGEDEDGKELATVVVCHNNTLSWNPNHIAFIQLKVRPGAASICHFLIADDIVWITTA